MEGHILAGRYRLLSVVGRGGMGTVWRAHDETLDREVAVKEVVLPSGLADDERENRHRRTLREARASARLGHPGVVTVHDVVDEDGRPWIVMELVRGRSLQDVLDDGGPLPPARVAAVGRQVVGALRAAHTVGILHRDVKPANVLLAGDGRAVLTDFGIAQVAGDATLTGTGMIMGSPAYMAPERVNGDAVGPASDLWSLGATLYAACEGRAPHQRDDAMAVLAAVLTQDPPPPRNAGPLAPALAGLLDRDPAARMDARRAEEAFAAVEAGRAPALPAPAAPPAAHATTLDEASGGTGTSVLDAQASSAVPGLHGEMTTNLTGQPPFPGTTPPGTMPPSMPPSGTMASAQDGRGGRRMPVALIIAGSIVATLAVTAGAFFLWPGGNGGTGGGGTVAEAGSGQKSTHAQDPDTQPGTSEQPSQQPNTPTTVPEATPPGSGQPTVPPGYQRADGSGFSIGIPNGWQRKEQGKSTIWTDPGSSAYVQVDRTQWSGDPYEHWHQWERQAIADGNLRDYNRLSITHSKAAGHPAADINFTWTRAGVRTRARDRGVVVNGRSYAIVVAVPASQWNAKRPLVKNVLQTFDPAGVG